MITNKDEAFHHNSCKKLAQLSKVIFAMNCMKQDQTDEKEILLTQFEDSINDISTKYIEELNNIRQLLFKYRKCSINKDCSAFGTSYKNLKKDFIDYFNEQTEKFLQVLNSIKKAQEEIKTYQVSSLQVAASFFEESDIITNELVKLEKAELSPTVIKKTINPIFKKMDLYNKQWNEHYNEIKENYKNDKLRLVKENKNLIQEEIRNYCSVWKDFLLKLAPIKSEISVYKDEVELLSSNQSNFFISQFRLRNQIIDETNQALKNLAQQKNTLIQSVKEYSSDHDFSVRLLEKDRQNNYTRYNQNFTKLQQEIHKTKHTRHQFQKSYSSRGEQLKSKLNENINILNQQFLTKRNNLLESQANSRKYILLGLKDSEHLLSTVSSLIKKSIDNERYNVSQMLIKIQQMQINQNSICDTFKTSYKSVINQQNEKFENCLQKFFSLNEFSKQLIEKVENLRGLYKSNQEEMSKEISYYNSRYKQEYQNECDNNQKLLKIKKEKSDSVFSQKVERKGQFLNQSRSRFNEDLSILAKTIKNKNENVIKDEKNSIKLNMFRFSEFQEHQIELTKINGRLEFCKSSIEQAKQIAEKTVEQLDHEISSIDKKIRQFKRSVKSSIQNIDQEFEMKIQVLQIDLNNKIENLSKLFTKEENDRGCEIIESLRRIKETENQKLNKILLLEREKEKMIQKFDEQINEKKKKIQDLKNSKIEKEIKEKVDSLNSNLTLLLQKEKEKFIDETNQIKTEISNSKSGFFNQLNSIKIEIENENRVFNQKCNDFINKKDEIVNNSKSEMSQKDEEFEKNVENIKKMHQKEIESLKRRIEFAKKIQSEEIIKQKNEINELKQKCNKEIELIKNSPSNCCNNKNYFENKLFETKFGQLANRQLDIHRLFLLNVDEQQNIQSKRLRLEFQSVKKTDDLSKEFTIHFQNLANYSQKDFISFSNTKDKRISFNFSSNSLIPNENKDESNGDLRNQLIKKISQNFDSSYSSGNISESNSHKKIPTLVTPRLAA